MSMLSASDAAALLVSDHPLTGDDARAFDQQASRVSLVYTRIALAGLGIGFIVFWPLDAWFLPEADATALAAMARFRLWVVTALALLLGSTWLGPVAARPQVPLLAIALVLCGAATVSLGPLLRLESGVVDLALLLPFGLVPLWVALRRRIALTLGVSAVWLCTLLAASEPLAEPLLVHGVTLLSLDVIAVISGHVIWNIARQNMALEGDLERVRSRLSERVEVRTEELRSTYDVLTRPREAERARLGRELHDATGQTLTGLRLELGLAQMLAPEEVRPRLSAVGGQLDELFEAVRTILMGLRPTVLDDLGLPAAVEWLVFQESRRAGVPIDCEVDDALSSVERDVAIRMFRATESALTVVLASRPERLQVELRGRSDRIVMRLRGTRPHGGEAPPREALLLLTERARSLGAELVVTPTSAAPHELTLTLGEGS